ncbi:protein kinase domain-containing protein [Thermocrispum municipale]|uniref:protein kinase domain-containing protein n=1 Tax=Thermocrispum municipale TaxID=37926 RepID=UPI00042036FB|nr:protein kinase [Thermocrispum municipale]
MEGTLIGERYRLTQPIAQGRAGSVWIAQDTRVNRTVVAKPVALRSPQDASFALEQAKHAARLRHRCAVTVYDVLAEGPRVWIVSEYVPSRSMADFLDGHGRLAFADTAMLGTQVSAAVAAAHEIGLLHRAIEPSNVLLADDGGVLITNFGVGGLHANPDFQAPEVIDGDRPTTESDVFALGATLFYAGEGTVPFSDDKPPKFRHLADTALQPLLGRMLSANPALRPTMETAWAELRAAAKAPHLAEQRTIPAPRPATAEPPETANSEQPTRPRIAVAPADHANPGRHPVVITGPQAPVPPRTTAIPWPRNDLDLAQASRPRGPKAYGLPSAPMMAAAIVLAVLVGVVFAELVLV